MATKILNSQEQNVLPINLYRSGVENGIARKWYILGRDGRVTLPAMYNIMTEASLHFCPPEFHNSLFSCIEIIARKGHLALL